MTDPELPADLRVCFWTCLNKAHKNVTWTGDVATCDTCGLTSEMTSRYRQLVRQHERDRITALVKATFAPAGSELHPDIAALLGRTTRSDRIKEADHG